MFLYLIVTTSESYLWTDNIRQRSAWAIRLCKPKLHKILERYQTRPRKPKEIRNQPVTRPPAPEPPFIVIDFSFNQTTLSKPPTTAGKKYILKICNPSIGWVRFAQIAGSSNKQFPRGSFIIQTFQPSLYRTKIENTEGTPSHEILLKPLHMVVNSTTNNWIWSTSVPRLTNHPVSVIVFSVLPLPLNLSILAFFFLWCLYLSKFFSSNAASLHQSFY